MKPERAILIVALALRIAWAVAVPVEPISDSYAYDVLARNLAAGKGFGLEEGSPTAHWSVGPAFLYSLSYRVFGESHLPLVAIQILMGVATVYLALRLAEFWFDSRVARGTGWILAFWPSQIQFTTILASEAWFSFVLLISCHLWFRTRWNFGLVGLLSGVVLGLGSYLRPTALLLPIVFGGLALLHRQGWTRWLVAPALALVLVLGITEPWKRRNEEVFGLRCGLTSNFGLNFWQGNHPGTAGWYTETPDLPELEGLNEAEVSRHLGRVAFEYVKEEPLAFVTRTVVKILKQHSRETIGVVWNIQGLERRYPRLVYDGLRGVSALYWMGSLVLALGGIVVLIRQDGVWRASNHPTVVIWAYFAAVHGVIVIQDRYSFQSIPFMAMLAALFFARVLRPTPDPGEGAIFAGSSRPRGAPAPLERVQDA